MFFIEDENFMLDKDKEFIEKKIFESQNFPFYFQPFQTMFDKKPVFVHQILRRPEKRNPDEIFNSPYKDNFISILNSFCKNNNLKYNEMLRCAINISFWNEDQKCEIHHDHTFPHCQLLICLNDTDPNSETVILDDDKKTELLRVKPKKYKGIYFENKPHYHYYPRSGYRSMLVYTFR